jgi:chitodextrinase
MSGKLSLHTVIRIAAAMLLLVSVLGVIPAQAAKDRIPPSKPTNLKVTGSSAYSVGLSWNPSSDNSGVFSYKVFASYGQTWTVPQTQTSFNWNFGLVPGYTYAFHVYAQDGSGNKSVKSNTVTVKLPNDTTPPSAPVVTVTDINPTEVALEWTASTDDGPHLFYQVYVNGIPNVDTGTFRSAVVEGLSPNTTYEITVKARDFFQNVSAPSTPVTVTTDAADPEDNEPPSPVGNLTAWDQFCGEVWLFWDEAFDNQTPQSGITYEVYVNGTLDHIIIGADMTILYGTIDGENTFTVIAIDAAGNRSEPANISLVLDLC